jgi:hypothetical protein
VSFHFRCEVTVMVDAFLFDKQRRRTQNKSIFFNMSRYINPETREALANEKQCFYCGRKVKEYDLVKKANARELDHVVPFVVEDPISTTWLFLV